MRIKVYGKCTKESCKLADKEIKIIIINYIVIQKPETQVDIGSHRCNECFRELYITIIIDDLT